MINILKTAVPVYIIVIAPFIVIFSPPPISSIALYLQLVALIWFWIRTDDIMETSRDTWQKVKKSIR